MATQATELDQWQMVGTVNKFSRIESGKAPDYYYQEFGLPRDNTDIVEVKARTLEGDTGTVAILDLRDGIKIYDIRKGLLQTIVF